MNNSFDTQKQLTINGEQYHIHSLQGLGDKAKRLPFSLKILLENLLRNEDGAVCGLLCFGELVNHFGCDQQLHYKRNDT